MVSSLFREQTERAQEVAQPTAPATAPPSANDRTRYFIGLAEEELRSAGLGASAERVRELERLLDPVTSDKEPL